MSNTIEQFELHMLLNALRTLYDFDFTNYREAYLLRRIHRRMELNGLPSITSLTDEIIHDKDTALQFVQDLSINVTTMFRCIDFYKTLVNEVFPILKTYPRINIWHAGCSSGEEVLSLAILLQENDLYDKCNIIATDIDEETLRIAQKAVYPIEKIKQWTHDYTASGGTKSFADYYDVNYNFCRFSSTLLKNVTFKKHDLTKGNYPKNMHFILCRNVLIYFNNSLQKYAIDSFHDSLVRNGFLGLGEKENIFNSTLHFTEFHKKWKIYQKQ